MRRNIKARFSDVSRTQDNILSVVFLCLTIITLHVLQSASQNCPTSYQCYNCIGTDCTSCGDGRYLGVGPDSHMQCLPCGNYCTICSSHPPPAPCDICVLSYGPDPNNSSQCIPCGEPNCDVCTQNITRCNPGGCSVGYTDTNTSYCGACDPNCLQNKVLNPTGCDTNGRGKCDKMCVSDYGLTSNNTCAPCSPNCAAGCSTTGAGRCDSCDAGYGLNSNGSCVACSANCSGGCNVTGQCFLCDNGFGITSNNSCAPCAANCSSCLRSGADKCDNCTAGFMLNGNKTCDLILTTTSNPMTTSVAITTKSTIATASGGSTSSGGSTTPGGSTTSGGSTSSGGSMASGGSATSGGSAASGASTSSGGSMVSGGSVTSSGLLKPTISGVSNGISGSGGSTMSSPIGNATCSPNCAAVGCNADGKCSQCDAGFIVLLSGSCVKNEIDTTSLAVTLVVLVFGGFAICSIATLVWCLRFHPRHRPTKRKIRQVRHHKIPT